MGISFLVGIIFHDIKLAYHMKQILLNKKIVVQNYIDTVFYNDIPFIKIDMNFKTREYLKSSIYKVHASESTMETESHFANYFLFLYSFLFTDCLLDSVFDSSAGNCAVLYSKGDYTLVGLRIQRTVL